MQQFRMITGSNRRLLLAAITSIVLVILLYIFTFSPPTIITSPGAKKITLREVQTSHSTDGRDTKKGFQLLNTGVYRFSASADGKKTYAQKRIRSFRINRVSLTLSEAGSAEKLAGDALGCAFTSKWGVYSYKCGTKTKVLRHSFSDRPQIEAALSGDDFYNLTPVDGGAVGFHYLSGSAPKFIYTDGVTISELSVPTEDKALSVFKISTSGQAIAVLNTASSKLYYFSSKNSRPAVSKLSLSKDIKTLEGASINLSGSQLSIKTQNPEYKNVFTSEKNEGVWLMNISAASASIELQNTAKLPKGDDTSGTQLVPISADTYGDRHIDKTVFYKLRGSSLKREFELPYATSIVRHNESAYLSFDGGVYKINSDDLSMHLIYQSARWNILRVIDLGGVIGFVAEQRDDPLKTAHVFSLSEQPQSGVARQDHLPYLDKNLSIRKMDYSGNKIYVQLILDSYVSDQALGKTEYSASEFQTKTDAIRKKLDQDGFTNQNSQITISF